MLSDPDFAAPDASTAESSVVGTLMTGVPAEQIAAEQPTEVLPPRLPPSVDDRRIASTRAFRTYPMRHDRGREALAPHQ